MDSPKTKKPAMMAILKPRSVNTVSPRARCVPVHVKPQPGAVTFCGDGQVDELFGNGVTTAMASIATPVPTPAEPPFVATDLFRLGSNSVMTAIPTTAMVAHRRAVRLVAAMAPSMKTKSATMGTETTAMNVSRPVFLPNVATDVHTTASKRATTVISSPSPVRTA